MHYDCRNNGAAAPLPPPYALMFAHARDSGPRVTHAHWRHYRPGILSLCSQTQTADLNTPDKNVWSVSNLPAERRLIAANERARLAGTYLLSESA